MTFKGVNILSIHSSSEAHPLTALWLHSHKGQRNAKHSALSNICLSFLLIAREEVLYDGKSLWRALTGRAGPMGIGTGVGGRAVAPQGGVALTAMGWREGEGTPKLAVGAGRRAQRTRA